MKHLFYIIICLCAFSWSSIAQETPVTVVDGQFESQKDIQLLKTFTVSKGDLIEIQLEVLHKKKGVTILVKQHPGNLVVMEFEELQSSVKKLLAPADAIYQVYFGEEKVDFKIKILNYTKKAEGPGRGEIVYVRKPDTLHVSGYVNKSIGQNFTLEPYTEKVLMQTNLTPEQICNRDFITGVDLLQFEIPGYRKDEYREQKLKSYSIMLTCGELGLHSAMMGVVDAGIDAFVKIPGPKSANKAKVKKTDIKTPYKFTEKLDEESNALETVTEIVGIASEAADSIKPNSKGAKLLENTAFVLDGGIQQLVLEKALDASGAPKEVKAIVGAVQSFPSLTDLAKQGAHKIIPTIKGNATLRLQGLRNVTETVAQLPQTEFWIQSAMNYGANPGGCWDIPGGPTAGQNGQEIKCWDIDQGIDRKFKLVPAPSNPGYYEIHSAMSGYTVDNSGGNSEMTKNGTDLVLWSRHGDKSQLFTIKSVGSGKYKIYNYAGLVVCLDSRSNKNGSQIHVWEDHQGAWTEWYFMDPATQQLPQASSQNITVARKYDILEKSGGYINEKIPVTDLDANKQIFLRITRGNWPEAKAKLVIEAEYEITDYTDVIRVCL
jgi:hypothetical protein